MDCCRGLAMIFFFSPGTSFFSAPITPGHPPGGGEGNSLFLQTAYIIQEKFVYSCSMAMARTVYSFLAYAKKEAYDTCVSAMEQGLLHVDTTNAWGWTFGYLFVKNETAFNKCLWDRYWALHPDVSLFWRLVRERMQSLCLSRGPTCVFMHLREALRSTPALWADLALVQPVGRTCVFIQEEIDKREACRFAWIAAVVQ
jgi:hypothetical protein